MSPSVPVVHNPIDGKDEFPAYNDLPKGFFKISLISANPHKGRPLVRDNRIKNSSLPTQENHVVKPAIAKPHDHTTIFSDGARNKEAEVV